MKSNAGYLSVFAFFVALCFNACKKDSNVVPTPPIVVPPIESPPTIPTVTTVKTWLVDKNATNETAALFYNMKTLAKTKVMFGHQADTQQGINGNNGSLVEWNGAPGRSDVREITGAYPTVYGWDMIFVASFQRNGWFDQQAVQSKTLTADAYRRGGVNTYSWHYWNPMLSKRPLGMSEGTNADFYYASAPAAAVPNILPGGSYNLVYNQSLDQVANYIGSLKDDGGKAIPIIFRLFHEQDGDWFWWGSKYCTVQQYKDLFQYTVKYLRDTKGLHNILFSWSPDRSATTEAAYLARYPGDDYVDVLGLDEYYDLGKDVNPSIGIPAASSKLKIMSDYAIKANKVAALTETGYNTNLTKSDWYTTVLLPALTKQKVEISYALVWANTAGGYWTPYKGHPAEQDFISFKNDPLMVFGDKIPNMYTIK